MRAESLLRRARRTAGLTQRDLARRTGITQGAIARIERGRVDPRHTTLERLFIACGWESDLSPAIGVEGLAGRDQIRRLVGLSDRDRERWFFRSNHNMLRLFRDGQQGS
ncbi:MAG: helix-turn-helix domain-containing protein [Chloroflexi bacterium]|nr:helix-turn-helix domain-containing protein [Chloroflexota bacterium]